MRRMVMSCHSWSKAAHASSTKHTRKKRSTACDAVAKMQTLVSTPQSKMRSTPSARNSSSKGVEAKAPKVHLSTTISPGNAAHSGWSS